MKAICALALTVLVSGCFRYVEDSPSLAESEAGFDARWRGHHEDEVIVQYGKPDEVLPLSSGHHVLSYHKEVAVSGSRAAFYNGAGSSSSANTTIFCDRRFEIDQSNGRIVRAVITGSRCDYRR